MRQVHTFSELNLSKSWVTIGSYDGIHLGHQSIIRPLVAEAHLNHAPAVVITFYPHPSTVLRGTQGPFYLSSPQEQVDLLATHGVDFVLTMNFDLKMAALSAEEFVQYLKNHLGISSLWVGDDFALGRKRQGTVPVLRELGKVYDFDVETIAPFILNGNIVSSSRIRSLLQQGEVQQAATLLGRLYRFSGQVVRGDGRGKSLGFPTANMAIPPERMVPHTGVYATWALLKDRCLPAITNIGIRPTFENQFVLPRVEAHILDADLDLYGQEISLEFVEFIRPERKFSTVNDLIKQIKEDCLQTQELLVHAR